MTHKRLRLLALGLALDAYLGSHLMLWEYHALLVPAWKAMSL